MDLHSWINTAVGLVAAIASAYAVYVNARADSRVKVAKQKADAKTEAAKVEVDAKLSDREQIQREYGLLLGGLRREIERLQGNQTNMWDFQMNRARLEYRKLEQGTSAIADVLVEARASLEPIREKLKALYATFLGTAQPERDRVMTLAIVRDHDPFIVEHLCVPFGMSHGECLLIALSVAKNGTAK